MDFKSTILNSDKEVLPRKLSHPNPFCPRTRRTIWLYPEAQVSSAHHQLGAIQSFKSKKHTAILTSIIANFRSQANWSMAYSSRLRRLWISTPVKWADLSCSASWVHAVTGAGGRWKNGSWYSGSAKIQRACPVRFTNWILAPCFNRGGIVSFDDCLCCRKD